MTRVTAPFGSFEFELLEAYCLGKSKLWNLFFGRRKIVNKGINGKWAYYKLNRKDYKTIYLKSIKMVQEEYNF